MSEFKTLTIFIDAMIIYHVLSKEREQEIVSLNNWSVPAEHKLIFTKIECT